MLKKSCQFLGLALLIGFSFFYTEKVANVVRDQDPLMIKIREYESDFNKAGIDAFVEKDSIIPGINACVVDINASYINMKRIGSYSSNMVEYKEIKPKLSLDNIYDKYIIKGNKTKNEVALVFKLNDSRYVMNIINTLSKKNVKASFFIDGKMIENETQVIYSIINQGHEIYNLGYDHKYDKDLLGWTNNMIESMSYNQPKYCLTTKEDKNVLDVCARNKMYTIKSDILINLSNDFTAVKNTVEKGSIIVFDSNDKTSTELNKLLLFLHSKGFIYNVLSNHLSEKGCVENN